MASEHCCTADSPATQCAKSYWSELIQPSLFRVLPPYLKFHHNKSFTLPPALVEHMKWVETPESNIVTDIVARMGFQVVPLDTNSVSTWFGFYNSGPTKRDPQRHPLQCVKKAWQKHSHVPGYEALGFKRNLATNIQRCQSKFGENEFGFHFKTFLLPEQLDEFKVAFENGGKWIYKPNKGYMSIGVKIVKHLGGMENVEEGVVQEYLDTPFLVDGHKFELRARVLVTSFHPLRIYLFEELQLKVFYNHMEQLQAQYKKFENSSDWGVPLYRRNDYFTWGQLVDRLKASSSSAGDKVGSLPQRIAEIIIKTLLTVENEICQEQRRLFNSYNSYQHWTMDFIFDEGLTPRLLEVNAYGSINPVKHVLEKHLQNFLVETLNVVGFNFPPLQEVCEMIRLETAAAPDEPTTFDEKLYTFNVSEGHEETQKKKGKFNVVDLPRDEYLDEILQDLTVDDVRQLMLSEDELSRTDQFQRIFPTTDSNRFIKYVESELYFYRLQDAWETRFGKNRSEGIALLNRLGRR